jgi:hypothetical protein
MFSLVMSSHGWLRKFKSLVQSGHMLAGDCILLCVRCSYTGCVNRFAYVYVRAPGLVRVVCGELADVWDGISLSLSYVYR